MVPLHGDVDVGERQGGRTTAQALLLTVLNQIYAEVSLPTTWQAGGPDPPEGTARVRRGAALLTGGRARTVGLNRGGGSGCCPSEDDQRKVLHTLVLF